MTTRGQRYLRFWDVRLLPPEKRAEALKMRATYGIPAACVFGTLAIATVLVVFSGSRLSPLWLVLSVGWALVAAFWLSLGLSARREIARTARSDPEHGG